MKELNEEDEAFLNRLYVAFDAVVCGGNAWEPALFKRGGEFGSAFVVEWKDWSEENGECQRCLTFVFEDGMVEYLLYAITPNKKYSLPQESGAITTDKELQECFRWLVTGHKYEEELWPE